MINVTPIKTLIRKSRIHVSNWIHSQPLIAKVVGLLPGSSMLLEFYTEGSDEFWLWVTFPKDEWAKIERAARIRGLHPEEYVGEAIRFHVERWRNGEQAGSTAGRRSPDSLA